MTKERTDPYLNLLVAATNKLIEEKHISLSLEGINQREDKGHIFTELFNYNSPLEKYNT